MSTEYVERPTEEHSTMLFFLKKSNRRSKWVNDNDYRPHKKGIASKVFHMVESNSL